MVFQVFQKKYTLKQEMVVILTPQTAGHEETSLGAGPIF